MRGGSVSPRWLWGAIGLSLFYLALALPLTAHKGLFHDEIFVLAIARLGGWGAIWRTLEHGVDNLPPLDYWLRHVSMRMFGENSLAFYLPSVLAVWAAILFVYTLVQRRLNLVFGIAAALVTLVVVGYDATFLVRGHALLALSFAAAIWCWDRFDDEPRLWVSAVFVIALAAGVYAQYYGSLLFVAFGVAAMVDQWRTTRWSLRPFALMAIAALLCAPLWPLVRAAGAYRSGFWTPVTLTAAVNFYPTLLGGAINGAVAIGLLVALAPALSAAAPVDARAVVTLPPRTTLALVAAACALAPMFMVARLATGVFHSEYAPSAAIALSILAIGQIARLRLPLNWSRTAVVVVPALVVCFMAARTVEGFVNEPASRGSVDRLAAFQAQHAEPVVLGDDALFVVVSYERQAQPLRNSYFVYDANPAQRTNVDRAIAGLSSLMPLQALPYQEFRRQHNAFLVVGEPTSPVIVRAMEDGGRVSLELDRSSGVRYWSIRFD